MGKWGLDFWTVAVRVGYTLGLDLTAAVLTLKRGPRSVG